MNRILSLYFLIGLFTIGAYSQTDTIEVSKKYKTILIFPENVAESIIGNDLMFNVDLPNENGSQYNRRILKLFYNELAKENVDYTNYTVITESGLSFDFILKLVNKPQKLTWYISEKSAVTNINNIDKPSYTLSASSKELETQDTVKIVNGKVHFYSKDVETVKEDNRKVGDTIGTPTKELYNTDVLEYYRLKCYYMDYSRSRLPRFFSRTDDVFLWLMGVYYNKDEIYFQFRIENKESVDLDVNFINYSIATNYKRSSSNQKVLHQPVYIYNEPKKVKGEQSTYFVAVFKKFSLDKHKQLVVDLDEDRGNRGLSLAIPHKIINNPIRF